MEADALSPKTKDRKRVVGSSRVMKCVEALGKQEFQLEDVYAFEDHLSQLYPGNENVRPKIWQQLQFLETAAMNLR